MSSSTEAIGPDLPFSKSSPPVSGEAAQACVTVGERLAEAERLAPSGSEEAKTIRTRLIALGSRLATGRLQLAVVGQFKRGKSTLLNAFLGAEILPSAVTPLTALPTFIRYGKLFRLISEDARGVREDLEARDTSELRKLLEARVTEDGNPRNRLGLVHVEIELPATLLATGLVFVDTPGVGSTYRHNTSAAEAALPECDAALFVVSPDPPITEVELAYLKQLRLATSTITIVSNKIDVLEERDRERSEKFLRRVVGETTGALPIKFFNVSARLALAAKLGGDDDAYARSGFRDLEDYIAEFARSKRLATLEIEIAHKAASLVRELAFIVELRIGAHRMPLSDLSERLKHFRAALPKFELERDAHFDRLQGDRQRLLTELERLATALRIQVETELSQRLEAGIADSRDPDTIWTSIAESLPNYFQDECDRLQSQVEERLLNLLARHQQQADELIGSVRQAAATLLDVPYYAPLASAAFQMRKIPYWVTASRETLGAIPSGLLVRMLPSPLRRRWRRTLIVRQIREIVVRNVENLRWALRQNLEDAIRAFQIDLDDRLASAQHSTEEAIEVGLGRRTEIERDGTEEIAMLTKSAGRLHMIAADLVKNAT